MHGSHDASANTERNYTEHLFAYALMRGKASPCVFWNPKTGVRCMVHSDDATFTGTYHELDKCTNKMQNEYDGTVRDKLGPDETDDQSMTM